VLAASTAPSTARCLPRGGVCRATTAPPVSPPPAPDPTSSAPTPPCVPLAARSPLFAPGGLSRTRSADQRARSVRPVSSAIPVPLCPTFSAHLGSSASPANTEVRTVTMELTDYPRDSSVKQSARTALLVSFVLMVLFLDLVPKVTSAKRRKRPPLRHLIRHSTRIQRNSWPFCRH
jgi:hypothetical protein